MSTALALNTDQLALPGLDITATGARPTDLALLDPDAILGALGLLRRLDTASRFVIGDLAWALATAYDNDTRRALTALADQGHDRGMLSAAMAVAASVPHEVRRESLTWSHHKAVRSMSRDAQARWLTLAEVEGWTALRMESEITADRGPVDTPLPGMRRLPAPPASALRAALAESPVVMWSPDGGALAAARVRHAETVDGRCVFVVEVDPVHAESFPAEVAP